MKTFTILFHNPKSEVVRRGIIFCDILKTKIKAETKKAAKKILNQCFPTFKIDCVREI